MITYINTKCFILYTFRFDRPSHLHPHKQIHLQGTNPIKEKLKKDNLIWNIKIGHIFSVTEQNTTGMASELTFIII